jgi:hypothetical protein
MTTPPLVAFLGRLQITDAKGAPCPGAQAMIFSRTKDGATEVMPLFADAAHSLLLPNPVVADASGMLPLIYLDSSPFDCIASTADNRMLWGFQDYKGFAYAGRNTAAQMLRFASQPPAIKADRLTGVAIDRDRDVVTFTLGDRSSPPMPMGTVQFSMEACRDMLRYIGLNFAEPSLGGALSPLRSSSEKPN